MRLRKCEYGAVENGEIDEEVCMFAWSKSLIDNCGTGISEIGKDGR